MYVLHLQREEVARSAVIPIPIAIASPLLSPQSKLSDALLHTKEQPMFPRKAPNRRGAASANQNANAAKGRQPQSQMLGAAAAAAHFGRPLFPGTYATQGRSRERRAAAAAVAHEVDNCFGEDAHEQAAVTS